MIIHTICVVAHISVLFDKTSTFSSAHCTAASYCSLSLKSLSCFGDMFCPILPQPRYCHLKIINLEFAQDIDDRHFVRLKEMGCTSLQELELLNINACQKVSDKGIETITSLCPNLRALSIYWIVGYTISECFLCHTAPLVSNWWTFCFHRLTDLTIRHIVQNCKHIVDLNLSGCKVMSLSAFPS
jgi:F-box/leucine-rich repeat protein 2/20